jgi:hypothetical protein
MNPHMDMDTWLRRRELDARVERRTLERWLGLLTPIRWAMVIGSTVLSAVAGAAFLGNAIGPKFSFYAGIFVLVAAISSTLHTALHCDAHQALCLCLVSELKGIEIGYQTAQSDSVQEQEAEKRDLDQRYEKAVSESAGLAPRRYRRKAEAEGLDRRRRGV